MTEPRIVELRCGCRYDRASGCRVRDCPEHPAGEADTRNAKHWDELAAVWPPEEQDGGAS